MNRRISDYFFKFIFFGRKMSMHPKLRTHLENNEINNSMIVFLDLEGYGTLQLAEKLLEKQYFYEVMDEFVDFVGITTLTLSTL